MLYIAAMRVHAVPNPNDTFSQNLCNVLTKSVSAQSGILLTKEPGEADVIIFFDSYGDRQYRFIREHDYTKRFQKKCFLFSQCDFPIPFLPGIYANLSKAIHTPGWSDSFCYVDSYRKNPFLKYQPEVEKTLLFSFLGRDSDRVRRDLFALQQKHEDVLIENTDHYCHWAANNDEKLKMQKRYIDVSKASKFMLCPRGQGVSSYRFFEAMELGIAPVLISDACVLPSGVDWDSFMINVPENKVKDIVSILKEREPESESLGRLAREAWEQHFNEGDHFKHIIQRMARLKGWEDDLVSKNARLTKKALKVVKKKEILFKIKCSLNKNRGQ